VRKGAPVIGRSIEDINFADYSVIVIGAELAGKKVPAARLGELVLGRGDLLVFTASECQHSACFFQRRACWLLQPQALSPVSRTHHFPAPSPSRVHCHLPPAALMPGNDFDYSSGPFAASFGQVELLRETKPKDFLLAVRVKAGAAGKDIATNGLQVGQWGLS
jgi:hypothetical protein